MKKLLHPILFLFGIQCLFATDFYVDDNSNVNDVFTAASVPGSDAVAVPGTASNPFATLKFAISRANAGDRIFVDAGIYTTEVGIVINKALIITGAGTNLTFIDNNYAGIVASVSGENTAYEQVYVLTDAVGSFISQNNTGVFPTVSLVAGDYRVYALNYSTSNPPNPLPSMLAVGSPLSMVTGGCFNQDFLSDYLCYSLNCLLGGNLLSFSGEKSGQSNKLSWTVEHPEKISRYILERSPDGFSDFKEIFTLGSSAEYNFVFLDRSPLEKSYYRLKMIDLDNSVEYSGVILLEQQTANSITIYPNPTDNILNLRFDTDNASVAQVRIFNTLGQVVSEISLDSKIGLNTFSLNLNELSSGEYCLQLNLTNESRVFKFTKK